MEPTKVMTEYPKKKTIRWVDDETGEECGRAKYIRADAPELVALVELAENIREYGGADIGDWEQAKAALAGWKSLTNG